MQEYQDLSDEELILRLRDGDENIMDFIINKYKGLVKSLSKSLYLPGGDYEDLLQEGTVGLFKAIRDYDPGRDASFFTFAQLCIKRQICSALQAADRKKHSFLNCYVSLYENGPDDEGKVRRAPADLLAPEWSDPEALLIAKENKDVLEEKIEEELSDFEYQVLEMHMAGMEYKEIATILMKSNKTVDNALQRAKTKVRGILNKYTASNG